MQEVKCDGLNENELIGSYICVLLSSPVGGTALEGLGVVALGKMCLWGWALRFKNLVVLPSSALCLLFLDKDISSQSLLQHHVFLLVAKSPIMMIMDSPSETLSTN